MSIRRPCGFYFFRIVLVFAEFVCLYSTQSTKNIISLTRTYTIIPIKLKYNIRTRKNKEENQDQIKENINT